MALEINYNYKINYSIDYNGKCNSKDQLLSLLTSDQMSDLESSVEKTFDIQGVYCKIDSVSGNKESITLTVGIYRDKSKLVKITVESYNFVPSLNSADNFIKQGYNYLKTTDNYKDATDLLDEGQTA